jgi:hypothetical protein
MNFFPVKTMMMMMMMHHQRRQLVKKDKLFSASWYEPPTDR